MRPFTLFPAVARLFGRVGAAFVVPVLCFALAVPAAMDAPVSLSAGEAAPVASASPALAFEMPSTSTLRAKPRKVFAHYYPPFPVSLDNQDPASDYYVRNFLNPDGEGGKHKAYGGWIRDRPVTRAPLGSTWRVEDAKTEVRQAVAAGLDGFAVDLMVIPPSSNWQPTVVRALFRAAEAVDPGFKLMPMIDMAGNVPSVNKTTIAAFLAELAASPAAHRINGKLALSAFLAEKVAPSWYTELFTILKNSHGVEVVFIPTFLNIDNNKNAFAPISAGWGDWGDRNPAWNDPSPTGNRRRRINEAHAMGKMFMQPVSIQDQRMRSGIYDESNNTENLRKTWQIATEGGAELVQLPTWNDYTEGTQFAPTARSGPAWLDINAYYLTTYKMGAAPAVVRDTVYLTHRTQPHAALPSYPQTLLMKLRGGSPARDTVEALTFLTAPATVHVTVGALTHKCSVPAGPGVCTVPLSPGAVSAKVVRDTTQVASVTSPVKVTTTPYVQNLHYTAASSGRQGTSGTTTTVAADTTAPSAPTNVTAAVSGSTVSLAWTAATDNVGVTQYDVHRSTTATFTPSSSTLVGSASTTSFTNSSVASGTWYYRIMARDAAGNWSAPSTAASAVIADSTAPTVPAGLTAAVSGSSVALSWTASTDNVGVTQYDVHRGTVPDFSPTPYTVVAGVTGTSYTHTGVSAGTWYYRVAARDAAGNWSGLSTAAAAVVADVNAPTVPTGVTATVSGLTATLSWTASTDNVAVTGYDIYRSSLSGFTPGLESLVGTVTGTSFTYESAVAGTTYYRVVAKDAAGNRSSASAEVAVTLVVVDTTAPSAPAVTALLSGSTVSLSWPASTDNVGVAGYEVHRSASSSFVPSSTTLLANIGGTSYTNTSVPVGTWTYRIVAKDAAGNRAASLPVSVTVADTTAPTAPTQLAVASGAAKWSVRVSWAAATDNVGATGYYVYRSSSSGFSVSTSTLIGYVTTLSFTDTSVPRGTWYYRVVARDAVGNRSVASTQVAATMRANGRL